MEEKDFEKADAKEQLTEEKTDEKEDLSLKESANDENVSEEKSQSFADTIPAKWYVLHTFSGYENVAKKNLETVVEKFNLQDRIFDIVIPMEDVVEEKNGKKKLVQRKSIPCYIFVKMKYADDLWHNVTIARGITGFAGPKGRPLPLTDEEVLKMKLEKIKVDVDVEVGDTIEVIDGPLSGMIGKVSQVNTEMGVLTAVIEMFGRETSVELQFSQIRKANQ